MKKSSFFAGMLTMLLILGLGGTAFAAAYQKQATLNYQGIKITLDGEEITPKDGAGNVVEPLPSTAPLICPSGRSQTPSASALTGTGKQTP